MVWHKQPCKSGSCNLLHLCEPKYLSICVFWDLTCCIHLHPPGSRTGRSDWCYWSSCSSPPQFWPPGKKCETRSSPQRGACHGSPSLSEVARSAFQPHTPSGQWCGLAFWSSCFGSIPAHQGYHSCDLFEAQTNVSSMPAGKRNKQLLLSKSYKFIILFKHCVSLFKMQRLPFFPITTVLLVMTSHENLITAPANKS